MKSLVKNALNEYCEAVMMVAYKKEQLSGFLSWNKYLNDARYVFCCIEVRSFSNHFSSLIDK